MRIIRAPRRSRTRRSRTAIRLRTRKNRTRKSYGLFAQDGAVDLFVRRFAAGKDHYLGWSVESGCAEKYAWDEAWGAVGDLSHRRREERRGDGVGGVGGCVGRAQPAGEDQSREANCQARHAG